MTSLSSSSSVLSALALASTFLVACASEPQPSLLDALDAPDGKADAVSSSLRYENVPMESTFLGSFDEATRTVAVSVDARADTSHGVFLSSEHRDGSPMPIEV